MRILLITWACDADDISEPGVSAQWVRQLTLDHEVTVFSVSKPERYGCVKAQFPDIDVIEWQDIKVPKLLERFRAIVKPGYLPYYFRARRFLKKLLATQKFDVIHHLSPFAWRYPSPAAGLGVPLVRGPVAGGLKTLVGLRAQDNKGFHPFMFLRNTDSFRMKFDPFLRHSYRQTDHLLMAAPYMQDFLKSLPIDNFTIEIELGFSVRQLQDHFNKDRACSQVKILYVGRLIQTKGLRYAIHAFSKAKYKQNATLTVIGDGDDLDHCKNLVDQLGLQDKVNFLGWKSKTEVDRHYQDTDIFIFPSYREPTGGVLMEAMAHGIPCITCAYGGPDYLIDETCGIKVKPTSEIEFINSLAQGIDFLIGNPDIRKKMSGNALKRVEQQFGWQAKRERIKNIYQSLQKN